MSVRRFVCRLAIASALCANCFWIPNPLLGQQQPPGQSGVTAGTGTAAPTVVWSASSPATLAIKRGAALPIAITTTTQLQGIRVVYSTLQEPTSQVIIPPDSLQVGRTNSCAGEASYAPRDPKPVLLCVHPTQPGSYVGTVVLGALNAGEAKPLNLTVHVSSEKHEWYGAGFIALGILSSWVLMVFLRGRSAHNEALLPAIQLRSKADELASRVAAAQLALGGESVVGSFIRAITELRDVLSESNLTQQRYVPSKISSAFAGSAAVGEGYPQFLQATGTRITVLTILVRGLEQVATGSSYPLENRVGAARMLDEQADDPAGTLEQAKSVVTTALAFMHTGAEPTLAPSTLSGAPAMPTTQDLLIRQQHVNLTAWAIWAILTLVGGYAALVLSNPGFGTETDLVKCFLWGVGVQIAGTQLQQITPSTISSTINVSIPKA